MIESFTVPTGGQQPCSRCKKIVDAGGMYYGDPDLGPASKPWKTWCEACQNAPPAPELDDGGPAKDKSLLDEFAGMVMQGIYAATQRDYNNGTMNYPNENACAKWAYGQADAMLAERKNPNRRLSDE